MKILRKLADIPRHREIVLYGAGQAGVNVLNILKAFRQDLTVLGFIDTWKTGAREGLPIYAAGEFFSAKVPRPLLVLIASLQWPEIEAILVEKGWCDYLIIPPRFIVPSAMGNLRRDKQSDPCQNTLSADLFSKQDRRKYKAQLDAAEALLSTPGDRALFRILTGQTGSSQTRLEAVTEFYYHSRLKRQYFDFIDYSRISTLIEGGTADGGDTVAFLKAMPPGGKVYGFEPNMVGYHNSPYYKHLAAHPRVKIFPKGLWSRRKRLYFKAAGLSSRFAEQEPVDIEGWNPVDVVSIDEFVREENIGKVDFIKMDIEGAELEALKGAAATLRRDRPRLAICIYHCKEHFFQVPLFLGSVLRCYECHLGHYTAGTLETVWYGIPR